MDTTKLSCETVELAIKENDYDKFIDIVRDHTMHHLRLDEILKIADAPREWLIRAAQTKDLSERLFIWIRAAFVDHIDPPELIALLARPAIWSGKASDVGTMRKLFVALTGRKDTGGNIVLEHILASSWKVPVMAATLTRDEWNVSPHIRNRIENMFVEWDRLDLVSNLHFMLDHFPQGHHRGHIPDHREHSAQGSVIGLHHLMFTNNIAQLRSGVAAQLLALDIHEEDLAQ